MPPGEQKGRPPNSRKGSRPNVLGSRRAEVFYETTALFIREPPLLDRCRWLFSVASCNCGESDERGGSRT